MYPCEHCSRLFHHRTNLTRHLQAAHQQTSFKCSICAKPFNRRDNLLRHRKSHNLPPPHQNVHAKFDTKQETSAGYDPAPPNPPSTDITFDPTWQHPFTSIVAGPTGCGKTQFVIKFVKSIADMVYPTPTKIIYSYAEWQPLYQHLPPSVTLVEGLPDIPSYSPDPLLIVIDDQMDQVDGEITRLFTKGSHHRNISVIYIVQNLFDSNKEHRTISLNAHYLVIFKNPRDASQVSHLAKQMYPGEAEYVKEAFALATREPYGYMIADLKQTTPQIVRLRGRIFPGEQQEVYVRK